MKRFIYILAITSLISGFTACMDILDTTPYNQPSSSTMWTTENLTDMGVAGIYSNLSNWGFVNNAQGQFGHYAFDQWGYTGQARGNEALMNGTIRTDNSLFSTMWRKIYEGIHRANDAIANIPTSKCPMAADKKGRLVAEAKFLRAFHYYRLNELYRGVPIYLEPITPEQCTKGQSTEQEVWDQVVKDLTDCINEPNFPNIPDNINVPAGRATKGAAYALRGKTYMQMKKWDLAAADFAKVGECGYELFQGGYKELFLLANERSKEMIFSVQNIDMAGYGSAVQLYCGGRSAWGGSGNGWNTFIASPKLVDLYEYTDGRAFDWNSVISGYNEMTPADREVYFLRDTVDTSGKPLNVDVSNAVRTRLNTLSTDARAKYLPSGNEARIKKAYEGRDPRLALNVITPYSTFNGTKGMTSEPLVSTMRWPFVNVNTDYWTDSRSDFHYLYRKFVYEGAPPTTLTDRYRCPIDEPLIRYADVLLMWAEALVEQNKLTEAAEKVNMVRTRSSVDMPVVQYTTQSDLREKVRNERRMEFPNEGISFFDEMRWRTLKDTKFTKVGANEAGIDHAWGRYISPYTWLGDQLYTWPVPQSEIEKNPNLKPTLGWVY